MTLGIFFSRALGTGLARAAVADCVRRRERV